jgi:hypothetical protein
VKPRIMYIELKTGYSDDGPAWIGIVEFSKSGRTAYFNGHAFKHAGKGHYGDIETGENYWISGVKKNGEDRHRFGKGKIQIDKAIVDDYLKLVDFDNLPTSKYEPIEIAQTDKSIFVSIENEKLEEKFDFYSLRDKEIHKLTNEELDFLIDYCYDSEKSSIYNKARRSVKEYRIELEEELEQRNN